MIMSDEKSEAISPRRELSDLIRTALKEYEIKSWNHDGKSDMIERHSFITDKLLKAGYVKTLLKTETKDSVIEMANTMNTTNKILIELVKVHNENYSNFSKLISRLYDLKEIE